MNDRMPVLMAAFSVALQSRAGSLTAEAVDDLRMQAEALLDRGCQFRAGIILFATQYEALRRDPAAVAAIGAELQRCVDRAVRPENDWRERVDIDG